VNVFVVEDAVQVRKRLVEMVRTVPGVTVVGESDSVSGAIEGALNFAADTLLLDLQLVDGTGFDVLKAVKPHRPNLHVIVLSNFSIPQWRRAAFAAGADVVLDKSHEFARVPEILRGWMHATQSRRKHNDEGNIDVRS
jgi:DNA-binding NarL/FixJ family response regulator